MGIGISILVGAVGAILRYAVSAPVDGIDLHMVGVILMFVGAAGLVLSMLFWRSFAPFGGSRSVSRRQETVSRDGVVEQERVVRETQDHVAN